MAVLLVFLAHAGIPPFTGGFVGVDVFFVLSGYLITRLLLRELELTGRLQFSGFYARRLKRLLPALAVMLVLAFMAASALLSGAEARAQLASAPFAASWTSNLYFAFARFDYFDELAARDAFLHTWSLAVEEQFYLLWPAILWFLFRPGRLRKALQGLLLMFALGLAASVYWTYQAPQFGFYMMPSRMWQFALGGLVHLVLDPGRTRLSLRPPMAWTALAAGALLILGSATTLHAQMAYPGGWALAPSLGAAMVIAAGQVLERGNPLAHPVLVWIGDRSYSLYLWHWPILVLGFSLGLKGQAAPMLGLALLALLLAMLSYRWVELPFWRGRASRTSTRRTLLLAMLVMGGVLTVSVLALGHLQRQAAEASVPDVSAPWRADVPEIYRLHCDAWYAHARVEPCHFGPETARKTVVLWGDSIGAQWFSMVQGLFAPPDWRVIVLTKSSCPIIDVDFFYARIGKTYQVCTDWRNAAIQELVRLKPDVLIIGNALSDRFTEEEWVEGSSRILARLSPSVGTILLLPGTPTLDFDGPGCLARHLSPTGEPDRAACRSDQRMEAEAPVKRYLTSAAARFNNVHLVDLNDLVCPEGVCNAVNAQGLVVFRDSQHLTDRFVRSTIPVARARFEGLVGELRRP